MKGDLQILSIMKDKRCDFFCLFRKNTIYNRKVIKRNLTSHAIVGGLVQIDGRESCMGSAIVLQMRTYCLISWLGSNLRFLEDKDQDKVLYPVKT